MNRKLTLPDSPNMDAADDDGRLFAPSALQIGVALPTAFIATLAGLAMIPVLQSAFVSGFGGKFPLSALVTFLTTVAGVSIFGIGAAFWGLVFGCAVARLVERRDFAEGDAPQ